MRVFFSDAIDARLDFIGVFGVALYWGIDAQRRLERRSLAGVAPNVAMRRWHLRERRTFRSGHYGGTPLHGLARLSLALLMTGVLVASAFGVDPATVVRVVDGDTIEIILAGKTEKVRLIGVDTPAVHESKKLHRDAERTKQDVATIRALGRQASDFTKHLVHVGDRVRLEFDQQPRDRYQRLLAFVWLPDGRMLNETIICEGYSPALMRYPFRQEYMDRFRACERQAREGNKGLWREERASTTAGLPGTRGDTREPEKQDLSLARMYRLRAHESH